MTTSSKLSPIEKKVASQLVPPTPLSAAKQIAEVQAKLQAARSQTPKDAGDQIRIRNEVAVLTAQLAALTAAGAKLKDQAKYGPSLVKNLTPEEHKREAIKLQAEKEELAQRTRTAPINMKPAIEAKQEALRVKEEMLAAGMAVEKPVKVEPINIPVQRKPIQVPPVFQPPTSTEMKIIFQLLAKALPRGAKETDTAYKHRLRAYSERAIARFVRLGMVGGKDRAELIQRSVKETLADDRHSIETEAQMGVSAKDPATEAVEPFVDAAVADLEIAATVAPTQVPQSQPTEEQIESLNAAADSIVQELSQFPATTDDQIRDAVDQGIIPTLGPDGSTGGISVREGGTEPISMAKVAGVAAGLAILGYLFYNGRR